MSTGKTFTLERDKSIVTEGDKIRFTVLGTADGWAEDISLNLRFDPDDIEAIVFAKSKNGLDEGFWGGSRFPRTPHLSIKLRRGETSKSFEIIFKKDTLNEIAEGGDLTFVPDWAGQRSYQYTVNGTPATDKDGIYRSTFSVLDSAQPAARVDLSDESRKEGEQLLSTLICTEIGKKVYWRVVGIDNSDLYRGPLGSYQGASGEAMVNYEGRVRIPHWLAEDSAAEPNESFKIQFSLTNNFSAILAESTAIPVQDWGTDGNTILPSITLAVSPASVAEDGTTNLIYTFTRTGATTSALTVNYTVGGTATLGTDYTGIAAAPNTKTITFAAGSSTATVSVDPTADSTVESDETVALTLAAGTGYTVGTSTAVTGKITNDDVKSQKTTTLTGTQSTLLLTGSKSANGTGNALNTIITGNNAPHPR